MNFKKTHLDGVIIVEPTIFQDNRGFFMETFNEKYFQQNDINEKFVQVNHSFSKKNVLRGLHFQNEPESQGKLVKCISGNILDVAVDLRKDSPNYLKWISVKLSDENNLQIYIPNGFAHGFFVLSENAHVVYLCNEFYNTKYDNGIRWNDPIINIDWVQNIKPILSRKDANLPFMEE